MTFDQMIKRLDAVNSKQGLNPEVTPHGRNLRFQLERRDAKKRLMYERIFKGYMELRNVKYDVPLRDYINKIVASANSYLDLFWPKSPFPHQADFASSVMPEMLGIVFSSVIAERGIPLDVSAEADLIIECAFSASGGGILMSKNKRVDLAVVKRCELDFNGDKMILPVPLISIECKTNLDKNMLSGIEQSVADLKKTFPTCSYFVVSELSDFDVSKSNYASSGIDEIFILRRQKRGVVRNNPSARNAMDPELVFELAKRLQDSIDLTQKPRELLSARMLNGKLIGRNS